MLGNIKISVLTSNSPILKDDGLKIFLNKKITSGQNLYSSGFPY